MDKKLKEIIDYAYYNSPFYERLYNQYFDKSLIDKIEFDMIPLVEKKDVSDTTLNLIPEKWYGDFVEHKLAKYATSGSTGICLDIYWSQRDLNNSLLRLWYLRKKYYNISPRDKCCTFYSNRREGYDEPKQIQEENYLSFSKSNLDDKRLCEIYSKMSEFMPCYLIVEPSIALLLSECMKRHKLDKIESIKYIELTGEYLFDGVRKEIEECFGCVTANQYGAYEVNSIAFECPEGNMHCMSQNVFVEILDEMGNKIKDGIEGNIYVTSLTNHVMPFIRYKIGDRGKLFFNHDCKCGNSAPILKLTNGRCNDFIVCEDGSRIQSSVFVKAIENTNKVMGKPIIQYQIHQITYNHFIVKLVFAYDDVDMQKLAETFGQLIDEERLYNSNITFELYEELFPDNNTGKLYYFINKMRTF